MPSLPITPPTARAGSPQRASAPPPGALGDFAALLSQTTARTAHAEGPKNRPAHHEQPHRRDGDDRVRPGRQDDGHRAEAAAAADRPQEAAQPAAPEQPADATPTPQDGAGQPGGQAEGQDTGGQTPQPPQEPADAAALASAQAAAQAATDQLAEANVVKGTAGNGGPSAPQRDALKAALAAAEAAGTQGAAPVAGEAAAPTGKLQIPAELLNGNGGEIKAQHFSEVVADVAQGDLPPLPTAPPTASAAATAPTTGGPGGDAGANANNNNNGQAQQPPQASAAPTPVGQATPTPQGLTWGAAASREAPELSRGSLAQAADRVQELVRIATTRAGNARATLQLRPEALGQVDVQLRTTPDGLVATIAAHDQAGLDALQQAGSELRRMLEDKGVELHSLDLQLGAGAEGGFGQQRDAREASSGRAGTASSSYGLEDDDDVVEEAELTLSTAPSTPAGVLVDVQA